MLEREQWGEPPEHWLKFAREVWTNNGSRYARMSGRLPDFEAKAKEAFARRGLKYGAVACWVNIQVPQTGEGYDGPDYPHMHGKNNGMSLVHYLEPGDVPAPLDVLEDGKIVETIYPEKGLTVFIPSEVWHGARKNNGTTNRIAMIAMGHL